MIALPIAYRKGSCGADCGVSRAAPGCDICAPVGLTNTLGEITMPPHLRPARAPENCEKEGS